MGEYFTADGTAQEAYTPDEVIAKLEEIKASASAEAREQADALKTQLDEATAKLEEANKQIASAGDKGESLRALAKAKETAEAEVGKLKTEMDTKLSEIVKSISEKDLAREINAMADGDESLSKQIKFYYDSFSGAPKDDKERAERLKNATILATGGAPTPVPGSIARGGEYVPKAPEGGGGGKISPEAVNVAKNLGLTEEVLREHKLI